MEQLEHRLVLATANDDFYAAHTNQPLIVDMPGPLGNDSYNDCDPTPEELCDRPEASVVSGPAHGSITWQSGGGSYFGANPPGLSFTYVAAAGFTTCLK
jgi:hypothetical protein